MNFIHLEDFFSSPPARKISNRTKLNGEIVKLIWKVLIFFNSDAFIWRQMCGNTSKLNQPFHHVPGQTKELTSNETKNFSPRGMHFLIF